MTAPEPVSRHMRWIMVLLIWLAAPAPLYIWLLVSLFV